MTHTPVATIDFETRSACSLKKSGSWRYSLDPTTDVLCLAFRIPTWAPGTVALWNPAFSHLGISNEGEFLEDGQLEDLLTWIDGGGLVEAHNAWFERGIWLNVLVPRFRWPEIAHTQWRCSAAKAAAHALPRKLELAVQALNLPVKKDIASHKLMLKLSKPRKLRKKEREQLRPNEPDPIVFHESANDYYRLFAYCCQDVLAEEALSAALPDLSAQETAIYLLDQRINERGFALDVEGIDAALAHIAMETKQLNGELARITHGAVTKATQRPKLHVWFEENGLELFDTKGATVDSVLQDDHTGILPPVLRALEILRALGRSSTAKYQAMKNWVCPDGRVRGGLLYLGASTGRWTGVGIQPHNFTKGSIKEVVKHNETAWDIFKEGDREDIETAYGEGNVMEALASALRGAIIPSPGHQLYVADYSSIEARVLFWLAGDDEGIGKFRNRADLYLDMAEAIYHRSLTEDDTNERQLGKAAILGCGYQMGGAKFVATAQMYGQSITEDFAKEVVDAYREKYWRVKNLWWDMERAAIKAAQTRQAVQCEYVTWFMRDRFLHARLPSGRLLSYPDPEVGARQTPWGEPKAALSYMGISAFTRKWTREITYGGKIVENCVQAISRDIMANAMLRCEASATYTPILSVHDEALAESKIGQGSVQEFERLVAECPAWAPGCPVGAKGYVARRYRKA